MRHSERSPINWLRSTCGGSARTTKLWYYIILLLLLYYTTAILYTTLDAATVAVETSWRGNSEIVHTLQWHNSFTTAPTRLVATADILRFVVARCTPCRRPLDTGVPPRTFPDTVVVGLMRRGGWWTCGVAERSRAMSRTG